MNLKVSSVTNTETNGKEIIKIEKFLKKKSEIVSIRKRTV